MIGDHPFEGSSGSCRACRWPKDQHAMVMVDPALVNAAAQATTQGLAMPEAQRLRTGIKSLLLTVEREAFAILDGKGDGRSPVQVAGDALAEAAHSLLRTAGSEATSQEGFDAVCSVLNDALLAYEDATKQEVPDDPA